MSVGELGGSEKEGSGVGKERKRNRYCFFLGSLEFVFAEPGVKHIALCTIPKGCLGSFICK